MVETARHAVLETDLPGAINRRRGKVRDIYEYEDGLLLVASDRISAFDCVMPNGIPDKGRVLTGLSVFWFDRLSDIIPNHLISADVSDFPAVVDDHSDLLDGRAMWVKKAEVVPIECVARGYLSGSGWRSYQDCGEICGHKLPEGLRESGRLPEPIFTPATKAETGHDENITCEMCARLVGSELANWLEEVTLRLYTEAADYLDDHGLILADTKFEFGLVDGDLILIDEALTPDSSRYWDRDRYEPGRPQDSLDKQPVRDYLDTLDWDKKPPAPQLPADVVADTRRRYREIYRRITGQPLD